MNITTTITQDTLVSRSNRILDATVDGEIVLMNVDTGQYYAFTATSRAIWERLKAPLRVHDLCADLTGIYASPLAAIETDTVAFLEYLAAEKMIEIHAAPDKISDL